MARVKSRDTKPELAVRRLLYSKGYRYRLHYKGLPGRPDITFVGRRKVIFVHGCFWHRHENCSLTRMPKSRVEFWQSKLEGNSKRDAIKEDALRKMGWDVLVIWECEVRDVHMLAKRLDQFLSGEKNDACG